jgi:hypothetical protein
MRMHVLLVPCIAVAACATAPKKPPVAETSTSSAAVESIAPAPARPAPARDLSPGDTSGDPLGMDGAVGALPEIAFTPRRELRRNGVGDLKEGLAMATHEALPDAAATKLIKRLGKPTWIENGTKRVWVVGDAQGCQRLTLRGDGSVDFDGAPRAKWTMLSTFARQNACTGEIERERKE